jgi:hypothetical protein
MDVSELCGVAKGTCVRLREFCELWLVSLHKLAPLVKLFRVWCVAFMLLTLLVVTVIN